MLPKKQTDSWTPTLSSYSSTNGLSSRINNDNIPRTLIHYITDSVICLLNIQLSLVIETSCPAFSHHLNQKIKKKVKNCTSSHACLLLWLYTSLVGHSLTQSHESRNYCSMYQCPVNNIKHTQKMSIPLLLFSLRDKIRILNMVHHSLGTLFLVSKIICCFEGSLICLLHRFLSNRISYFISN